MYRKYNQLGEQKNAPTSYKVTEVQNHEHKLDIIRKHEVVCVDVHANWCQPCKQIAPDYAVMAKKYSAPGKCLLVKEDLELKLSKDFDIQAVPTFLIFHRGGLHTKIAGADLAEVDKTLQELLSGQAEQPFPPVASGYPPQQNQQQGYPPQGYDHRQGQQGYDHRPQKHPSQSPPYGSQSPPDNNQPQYRQNQPQIKYHTGDNTHPPTFNTGNRHRQ